MKSKLAWILKSLAVVVLIGGIIGSGFLAFQLDHIGLCFLVMICGILVSALSFGLLFGYAELIEAAFSAFRRTEEIGRQQTEIDNLLYDCYRLLQSIEAQNNESDQKTDRREREERNREYWREHAEERKRLEEQLAAVTAELADIQAESLPYIRQLRAEKEKAGKAVPAEEECQALLEQLAELDAEKKRRIPISRGSREISGQIEELEARLGYAREDAERQKAEVQQRAEANMQPILEALQGLSERQKALQERRNELEEELTRDR